MDIAADWARNVYCDKACMKEVKPKNTDNMMCAKCASVDLGTTDNGMQCWGCFEKDDNDRKTNQDSIDSSEEYAPESLNTIVPH